MVDVYENFKNGYPTKWCKTCYLFIETQEHIYNCFVIREKLNHVKFENTKFTDKEGSLQQQEKFAKNYTFLLKAREEILNIKS